MPLYVKAEFGSDLQRARESLESVELGLGRLVGEIVRHDLGPLVAEVKAEMPFDSTHRGWKKPKDRPTRRKRNDPGHIRDSIRGTSDRTGLLIRSSHPGGPVHWWGGHIRPKGAEIAINKRPGAGADFVSRKADEVGRVVDSAVENLLRANGL